MVVLIVVFLFKNKRGLCVLLIFCFEKNAGIGNDLYFFVQKQAWVMCVPLLFCLRTISCTDYVIISNHLFLTKKTRVLVMTCFSVQKQAWVMCVFLVVVFLFRFALLLLLLDDKIIIAIIIAISTKITII